MQVNIRGVTSRVKTYIATQLAGHQGKAELETPAAVFPLNLYGQSSRHTFIHDKDIAWFIKYLIKCLLRGDSIYNFKIKMG